MHGPVRPPDRAPSPAARRIFAAARAVLPGLEAGRPLDTKALQAAMTDAFGDTDAAGAWVWKQAYDAAEAAVMLLLRRYGPAMLARAADPDGMLRQIERIAALEPPQTRRDDVQQRFQQFSTPLELAWIVAAAADVQPNDIVLEPSAGTGALAAAAGLKLAPAAGGALALNELTSTRAGLLQLTFPRTPVTRHDAESINDLLPDLQPTLVVMNPPFSRAALVNRIADDMDLRHVAAAYRSLRADGRLVAITSSGCEPRGSAWRAAFARCDPPPDVLFTAAIAGKLYRGRGTTYETRITVLEKPAGSPRGTQTADGDGPAGTPADLLARARRAMPPRRPIRPAALHRRAAAAAPEPASPRRRSRRAAVPPETGDPDSWRTAAPLAYSSRNTSDAGAIDDDRPYQPWTPSVVINEHAKRHPTTLVQSAAMSAVDHRRPAARPRLPSGIVADGTLSDAQLESVVLAVEAHRENLPGLYRIDGDHDTVKPAGEAGDGDPDDGAERDVDTEGEITWSEPTPIRRGWMLGDGTGAGKGRQVAGIILDRWLQGTRRALWLSASDKLIEDARRDWTALGGRQEDVFAVNRWRQKDPVDRPAGVLFGTYSTLRSPARNGAPSRLEQMIAWLAGGLDEERRHTWDGVIVFDESHALSNAAGGRGSRGPIAPSQQGRAGVRLQNALPQARIVYVSATGASTIDGLCYASRLGLWGTPDTPFRKRTDFVQAMEAGGVAALEIVARDLKALGRYQARALSYTGVEVDILEHALTDEQTAIYNEYARAFKIIHSHLGDALEATRIDTDEVTNARAKAAAHSAFEGAKQRFFSHLLTSMKCPTLIRAVEDDLAADRAPVIQLVSTGEALTERRIAQLPASEWDDVSIDITPREYVLDYLFHAFPVQMHEHYEDEEGNIHTRPMRDADGNPVLSQEAVAMRDALMERLGSLAPIGSALDQILHHFGHEQVAEISGRSRRVLLIADDDGRERLAVRTRAPSANLHETQAFMDGEKPILVFSGAGNTGRSYHADLDCGNTRRRHHYLIEYGWRADQAIQGLGRTHRTHQRTAPVFRPVTTNVKGERRFTATIARRIHSLGAITRGQKDSQTGMGDDNATLFRECDNFESEYARAALRMFYLDLYAGRVGHWSAERFEGETGLRITDGDGQLLTDLPPMHTFLNRLLALEISEQNELFSHLEELVETNIRDAIESGTYNRGVERITAAGLEVVSRESAAQSAAGAATQLVEILRRDRLRPLKLGDALEIRARERKQKRRPALVRNRRSGNVALCLAAPARTLEDGSVQKRCFLIQPASERTEPAADLEGWSVIDDREWQRLWTEQCAALPEFRESRFWLVTGVLLPVWKKLPETDVSVYRLTTDDGTNLIGRVLSPGQVDAVRMKLGLGRTGGTVHATPGERMRELLARRCLYLLDGDLVLAGRRHMGTMRVEVEHRNPEIVGDLKALGCRSEIVQYRTRVYVPDAATLGRLLDAHPVVVRHDKR